MCTHHVNTHPLSMHLSPERAQSLAPSYRRTWVWGSYVAVVSRPRTKVPWPSSVYRYMRTSKPSSIGHLTAHCVSPILEQPYDNEHHAHCAQMGCKCWAPTQACHLCTMRTGDAWPSLWLLPLRTTMVTSLATQTKQSTS